MNSDRGDNNADTSITSETCETNSRVTKERSKRVVTTVNTDETGNKTPSKLEKVVNENKENDSISTGIENQDTGQINQDPTGVKPVDGENAVPNATEGPVSVGSSSSSRKWRHISSDCLACVRTRPPSSHELREAFFAGKNLE